MSRASDNEGSESYEWDSDEGDRELTVHDSGSSRLIPGQERETIASSSREASQASSSAFNLKNHFLAMGFSEDMVVKALGKNRGDVEGVLETLLAYAAIEDSPSRHETPPIDDSLACKKDDLKDDISDLSDYEREMLAVDESFNRDRAISTLVDMGFLAEEASSAIDRCGPDASVLDLADYICAAQMAEQPFSPTPGSPEDLNYAYPSHEDQERSSRCEAKRNIKRSRAYVRKDLNVVKKKNVKKATPVDDEEDDVPSHFLTIPNPMNGFSLPFELSRTTNRKLPGAAVGPPYFYYENVALAPAGVWGTISRFLFEIEPEFVDSKFLCAAARKRGYIHNLPINNRFPIHPAPPKTIHEALPLTKKWWPCWDPRTQFNCLQTCVASAKLTDRLRLALTESDGPPSREVQKEVLIQCRKWNLVWVGRNKLAPLEPDEIETLLGFPRDHTRGGGINRTDRYKSLGNSFQVDTVAYHLSVLKNMFPNGMNVLSLFSGIGGAEVALHRLGIRLKTVVSVELSEVNRNIVRCWWDQTNQTGVLIDFADVRELEGDQLKQLIGTHGGFDLVVGGSPCNNLAGSNRHHRDGLEGEHSSLFFDYCRILDLVRNLMGKS